MSRFTRFLNLERDRGVDRPERNTDQPHARFAGLEKRPEAELPAPSAARSSRRFEAPPPSPLEVSSVADGAQPFLRCMHCSADSNRHAARCERCGAALATDAQRAFNEALWVELVQQREAEQQQAEAKATALAQEDSRARRAFGEELAEKVRADTLRSMDEPYQRDHFGWLGGGWRGRRWAGRNHSLRPLMAIASIGVALTRGGRPAKAVLLVAGGLWVLRLLVRGRRP